MFVKPSFSGRSDFRAARFDIQVEQAQVASDFGVIWGGAMQSFIHRKNLENYRRQIAETPNDAKRLLLEKLLSEEVAKGPIRIKKRDDD